jgi:chromosome segregation ATPase
MTPSQQQANKRIRELEEEIQRLRKQRDTYDRALHSIRRRLIQILRDDPSHYPEINAAICDAEDALDGGGDANV